MHTISGDAIKETEPRRPDNNLAPSYLFSFGFTARRRKQNV